MKREKQLVSLSREQNRALLMARSGRSFARTGGGGGRRSESGRR